MSQALSVEQSPNLYLSQSGVASEALDADHFLVGFSGSVGQLTAAVRAVGGNVDRAHSEIGIAKVSGLNDQQAASLRQGAGVTAVTRDLIVQWVPANLDLQVLELTLEESTGKKGGKGRGGKPITVQQQSSRLRPAWWMAWLLSSTGSAAPSYGACQSFSS